MAGNNIDYKSAQRPTVRNFSEKYVRVGLIITFISFSVISWPVLFDIVAFVSHAVAFINVQPQISCHSLDRNERSLSISGGSSDYVNIASIGQQLSGLHDDNGSGIFIIFIVHFFPRPIINICMIGHALGLDRYWWWLVLKVNLKIGQGQCYHVRTNKQHTYVQGQCL